MPDLDEIPPAVRFAAFDLDTRTGELRRQGVRVPLHEKPFQVLKALVESPGELVTRQDLRGRLWSEDTFVDFDNNLNAAVKRLRDALGDSADRPRFIETLPRKGYRFIASVEPIEPAAMPGATSGSRSDVSLLGRRVSWAGLASMAVVAALWLAFSSRKWDRAPSPGNVPASSRVLLAVLPFENLDGDASRDYFADGLTEEMITQLGRLQPARLGVIARTSSMAYKNTTKTVDRIGLELGVGYVLEGSVRSSGGDRIRVTAQLVAVADQTHLWAETYDRALNDILEVQSEIAVRVAGALALELLPDQPRLHARAATTSTEAYEAYLRGRAEWNRFQNDAHRRAVGHFERALELDPTFPHAWAGLADAYNLLAFGGMAASEAFPKAIAAAERALELDRNLAMAHNSLGFARLYHEWEFGRSEEAFRRALELAPNDAMTYHWYTGLLSASGRHDEAIAACRKAVELDPVSLSVISDLGWYLVYAGRYDEAIEECRRTLELDRHYGTALACLQEAYVQKGLLAEAVDLMEHRFGEEALSAIMDPDPRVVLRRVWERELDSQLEGAAAGRPYPMGLAMSYARLGRIDEAISWLERAIDERDSWAVFVRVLPELGSLRGDPRFEALASRVVPSTDPA